MKPTPFEIETDLSPIPFDDNHCIYAHTLKEAGLLWKPHVGCFVWDREGYIEVSSPFPGGIYFIINLNHFLKIFETLDRMVEKLTWLPTWHQARLLCEKYGVLPEDVAGIWQAIRFQGPGDELLLLYSILLKKLQVD
jgi:hypothetical protein